MRISGNSRVELVLTVTLVLCAVVIVAVLVRRELSSPAPPPNSEEMPPTLIDNWRTHIQKGVRLGPDTAPVQILLFADFECPFCATFHRDLTALRERYPAEVATTHIHFPLPMHRFAEFAARLAECADMQGRFEAMQEVLYAQQKQFGFKPWSEFESEAGIVDKVAFQRCIHSEELMPRIVEGGQLAQELDIKGTPTILINGWKLQRPPRHEELERMIQTILAGNSPF